MCLNSCWMAWELSLGGFFAPMSLLVTVMSVYFLCTYIQLKRHPERKYELQVLSEEQQQLSFSESNHHFHHNNKGASGPSGDCQPVAIGMSVLGNEHSFKSQLLATAFTLFLFLATWALGALAVSQGHFLDMILSCLYGAFCVSLGLFLLIQHCAKRDDVWHHWWACCMSKPKSENGNGDSQSQRTEFHQPHCHLSSPCSAKQPLPSLHLIQSSYRKIASPPQSPTSSHPGPFCVAMMGRVNQTSISSLTEPVPSLCSQSLSNELPHLTLPLHNCLKNQKKSHFNLPCSCLQDNPPLITSSSMDGSVESSHLNSSHAVQNQDGSPLVSSSPNQDNQFPCISPQLGKQLTSCHSLQHQTSCHSAQDSMASCHRQKYNMYDSIISFHSLLLPSNKVRSCQWHMHSSADHSSTTSCFEKPNPFPLQFQQDPDTYSCLLKTADGERNNICVEVEHQDFPRNTLPRQNGTVSRQATIGRNRSLQEDGLLGSVAKENIQTGPWRNETTV